MASAKLRSAAGGPFSRFALDSAQSAAATGEARVQLALAGPGSGKTTTLAARFAHLVDRGVEPRRILAVTFTRKAADEMRSRIAQLLGLATVRGLPVMTFHAFAYRHLRHAPQAAGLPTDFRLWDGNQRRAVFHHRQMWWNEEIDIFDIIDGMKERLIDAAAFARLIHSETMPACYAQAAPFFAVYEAALREAGAIDFADMVPKLEAALRRHAGYRQTVVGAFDHLLVDEYQDVNPGQLALIDHFVASGAGLWAVGDDDQTLFAFRASDIGHVLDFTRRHPDATVHVLDRNYRSAPAIVDLAKALIRHNRRRRDKDYRPMADTSGEIAIRGYSTPEMEARQVAAAIALLLEQGTGAGRIAVLYRAGTVGLPLQSALRDRGIPFEVRGSGDLWQSTAARLVVGALHYLRDADGSAALGRMGRRGEVIAHRLDEMRATLRHDFQAACRLVRRIVGEALPASAAERERSEWTGQVDAVTELASAAPTLEDLERRIAQQSSALRNPPTDAVVLSTIHSAKGLEWDAVFVIGLEEGVLPNGNVEDVEEERRVAYVAVTRARRLLGLTFTARRYGAAAAPSRFLREMQSGAAVAWSGPHAKGADHRLPLVAPEEAERLQTPRPAKPWPFGRGSRRK